MRNISSGFKLQIKTAGRQLKNKISYQLNNETKYITDDDLFAIKYTIYGSLLKSSMKMLEFETKENIELNTILTCQIGLKVNGSYEYLDYGSFIVYNIEKQEDTNSYKITCYDKMLYSMVDYEAMNITYPITIRNYINAICTKLGLTFKNASDTFVNYDKEIQNELFLTTTGGSLGFTFRDVLDQLAEVTASTICIDDNGQLEIRYINNTNDTIDEDFLKNVNVKFGEKYGKVNSIVLSRAGESDNVYLRDEESVIENGLCEIKIIENQIMNFNDRATYLSGILNQLDGLEYYINDFSSTGILYYDLCDKYNVKIGDNTYSCVMFNDSIDLTNGLEENIYTEMPDKSETDYKKADKTDRRINQAYVIVDKQNQEIESLTRVVEDVDRNANNTYQQVLEKLGEVDEKIVDVDTIEYVVRQLQTNTYTKQEIQQIVNGVGVDGVKVTAVQTTSATFDEDGMLYEKTNAPTKTQINQVGVNVKDRNNNSLLFAGYVDSNNTDYSDYVSQSIVGTDNIIVKNYLNIGTHSRIQDYNNGSGIFFMN